MPIEWSRRARAILLGAAVAGLCADPLTLEASPTHGDAARNDRALDPTLELTTGSDHTADSRIGYGALVWAFQRSLYGEGWRLRVMGGFGRYAYDGMPPAGGGFHPQRFRGDIVLGELLLGRQWRLGGLFVKAYAGPHYVRHELRPPDAGNSVDGAASGAKGLVELWYARTPGWASLDASYATGFRDYRAQLRLAYRARHGISLGVEAAALGNREYDAARLGGFLCLHWQRLEATLAGGATGDYIDRQPSPYLSLGLVRKY